MSMLSNVGNPQVYEAGDQRPKKAKGPDRGAWEAMEQKTQIPQEDENSRTVTDPLKRAMDHGNMPSRGAQMDAELMKDDQEMLRQKDEEKGRRDEAARQKEELKQKRKE